MRLMSINRLACLRMYSLLENKQRKKGVANESSLTSDDQEREWHFYKTKVEHTWKDELLVVVGYDLEVFTIVWRAHCKYLFVNGFNHQCQ